MICGLVLSAGKGSRLKTNIHKPLNKILGKELIQYSYDALTCNVDEIFSVVNYKKEGLIKRFPNNKFINQLSFNGTGGALIDSLDKIKDFEHVVVMPCDMPLIDKDKIKLLIDKHIDESNELTFLISKASKNKGFGFFDKDSFEIIEEKYLDKDLEFANVGVYVFKVSAIIKNVDKLKYHSEELYITDLIKLISGKKDVLEIDNKFCMGVNDVVSLNEVTDVIRLNIINFHISNDVVFENINSVVIYHGVVIKSNVFIRSNVVIESNNYIGSNCIIGPFSFIRNKNNIDCNVKIGTFCEIKNSIIKKNSVVSHHCYIGDSKIGSNVNIGCGVITCNFNGSSKETTIVGDNTLVGANVNLVAPVSVGSNCFIAAGSTIVKNVLDNEFSISRIKQENRFNTL